MYSLKTALSSLGRNAVMTIASIITIACSLFLFGVFLLFAFNINYIGEQISDQCELQAYIVDTAGPADEERILHEIASLPNVKSVEFESKEQAFENFLDTIGEKYRKKFEGMEGTDFLRSSVKIVPEDLNLVGETEAAAAAVRGVADVQNREETIRKVISLTNIIKIGSLIAMLVLLLTAIFIIQNTIKLSVHAREEEIHIMKFVGATDGFIRRPFVLEGVIVGIIGAAVAIIVISFGYGAVLGELKDFLNIFKLYSYGQLALPVVAALLIFGIVMGNLGSRSAIRRHLKV